MTTLSTMLWRDAGEPGRQPCVIGACYVCGAESDHTVPLRHGMSDSFTAHDQCADLASDRVCAACAWVMGGRSSKALHTWRLYSVLWREDGAVPERAHLAAPDGGPRAWCGNRGDLRPMLRALLAPPPCAWSVSFAVSGQLQVVPFAPVVAAEGVPVVQFERLRVDCSDVLRLMPHVAALRGLGMSSEEITAGRPSIATAMKLGAARAHMDALRTYQGAPLVQMLAWALKCEHAEEFL